MECLVTPDLTNESIVSRKDAEAVGAITVDRADTNIEPKERNLTKLKNTQKNIKQKPTKEYQDHMANKRNRGLRQRSRDRSTNRSYRERDHHNDTNETRGRKKIRRSAENPAQATPDTPEAPTTQPQMIRLRKHLIRQIIRQPKKLSTRNYQKAIKRSLMKKFKSGSQLTPVYQTPCQTSL